jgi:hypothetical protein
VIPYFGAHLQIQALFSIPDILTSNKSCRITGTGINGY